MLSIVIVTPSFACPFGSGTDSKYFNDDILDLFVVEQTLLCTGDWGGQTSFCFCVDFEANFWCTEVIQLSIG